MKTFDIYFWVIIIFIGTIGVWIPIVINLISGDSIDYLAIPLNITSYFIVLLITSSTDRGLDMLQSTMPKRDFLIMVTTIIGSMIYVGIISILVAKNNNLCWLFAGIGLIFSLYHWYQNSKDNPKYTEPTNALGGSTSQFKKDEEQ